MKTVPLHDLECVGCANVFEERLEIWVKLSLCPECGELSKIVFLVPPMVMTNDSCDPFRSEADGKYYTSKSKYRRSLKAHGMLEMGNERPKKEKYKPCSWKKQINETLIKKGL